MVMCVLNVIIRQFLAHVRSSQEAVLFFLRGHPPPVNLLSPARSFGQGVAPGAQLGSYPSLMKLTFTF